MGATAKYCRGSWWVFINHQGIRRSKKIGDRETAREVARQIRRRLAEGDLGLLASHWLEDGEPTRKATTHRFYAFNLTLHILPVLGTKLVPRLTRGDCRELLAVCRAKGLKPASLRGVNRTLSTVLSQAVEDVLLPANPAFRMGKYLRTGDELPPEIEPLTRGEAHALVLKAEEVFPEYSAFFLCALRTGMRLGELLELHWADVDFTNRCIHVRRNRVSGKVTSTKNKHRRRLDMSLHLTKSLKSLRTRRQGAALRSAKPVAPWVFVTPTGQPIDGDNLRTRVFYRLLEKAELRQIRFHDLRHTYASLLIQQGVSLAYVQEQLGHSSIKVTVDTYGHLIPGANRTAVDRLDAHPICIPGASDAESGGFAKPLSD